MGLIILVALTAKHTQNVMPRKSILYISLGLSANQYMSFWVFT